MPDKPLQRRRSKIHRKASRSTMDPGAPLRCVRDDAVWFCSITADRRSAAGSPRLARGLELHREVRLERVVPRMTGRSPGPPELWACHHFGPPRSSEPARSRRDSAGSGRAFSSEVDTGSREENASRQIGEQFSSEVDTGSREENASKQIDGACPRFEETRKCSSLTSRAPPFR